MIDRFNNDPIASHASLHSGDFTSVLWSRGQAIILAVLVVVLPACNQSVSSGSNTTISEIANDSNTDLIGKTVTVSGEIEEVISPKAFTIEGDQLFKDPEMLVVNATEAPIIEDTLVQVTGTVSELVGSEIERKFDLNLAQEFEVEFRDKPVLIATAVILTPLPGEIAEEPSLFIGKTVTVSSIVDQVISPNAFTLDDKELIGGKELLVVGAIPSGGPIYKGNTVLVRSTVRKHITAEIEKDFDFDLQPDLEVEYKSRPVVIAQSIKIVK